MTAPALKWRKVQGALTTEYQAPSSIVGRTYTIARYDGQSRDDGQWRLTASDDPAETLQWDRTLAIAKRTAQAYEEQRVADAARRAERFEVVRGDGRVVRVSVPDDEQE